MGASADLPRRGLSRARQRRLRELARALQHGYPAGELLPETAERVGDVFGSGHAVVLYLRTDAGGFGPVGQTVGGMHPGSWEGLPGIETLSRHFRYELLVPDEFAGRSVDEVQLYAAAPQRLSAYRDEVLERVGLWYQLRATLYASDRFVGYFGILRPSDGGRFGRGEAAAMEALLGPLRDWMTVAGLLHEAASYAAVTGILDALEEPTFLTTLGGAVVHANSSARSVHPSPPPWLAEMAKQERRRSALGAVHRVEIDGHPLVLVRTRPEARWRAALNALPPHLRRTAALMSAGASDKDVASELGLSLATARTYAQRILSRLEMHDRRELMTRT